MSVETVTTDSGAVLAFVLDGDGALVRVVRAATKGAALAEAALHEAAADQWAAERARLDAAVRASRGVNRGGRHDRARRFVDGVEVLDA